MVAGAFGDHDQLNSEYADCSKGVSPTGISRYGQKGNIPDSRLRFLNDI